jgi:multidrug efflux pump subunit AcrA (membrane-fusion protein)
VTELKEGTKASVSLDAYPDKIFLGRIRKIHFSPNTSSGSPAYPVEIEFSDLDNGDLRLRLQMEGEAEIIVASANDVLLLPLEAVRGEKERWVYVLDKQGRQHKRKIKVGVEGEDAVEVIEGLSEGEKILLD